MARSWLILEIENYEGNLDALKAGFQRFLSRHVPEYNPHVDNASAVVVLLQESTTHTINKGEIESVEHKISGEILLQQTGEVFPFQHLKSRYTYRNLPSNVVADCFLWCVLGEDVWSNKTGVLEWCTCQEDAQEILDEMKLFRLQFRDLYIMSYEEHTKSLLDLRKLRDANGLEDL